MCDYQGHEFGASYPDSVCIEGYLWDADSCEEPGGPLHSGGDLACPRCNTAEYLQAAKEESEGTEHGFEWRGTNFLVYCGATLWENAVRKAIKQNASAAHAALALFEPFRLTDWPDRQAVLRRDARYTDTVTVCWSYGETLAVLEREAAENPKE